MIEKCKTVVAALRRFCHTPWYYALVTLIGVFGAVTLATIPTLMMIAVAVMLSMLVCEDCEPAAFAFYMLMVVGTVLAEDFSALLRYWPWAIPAVLTISAHFVLYPKARKLPRGVFPLIFVAAAVFLGGIGSIAASDYFSPLSLIYMTALGPGILLMYTVNTFDASRERSYDPIDRYLLMLMLTGFVQALFLILPLLQNIDVLRFRPGWYPSYIDYRNSASTYLLMAMPSAFYFADKKGLKTAYRLSSFAVGLLIFCALVLSLSRAALVYGCIELFVCFVYYGYGKNHRKEKGTLIGAVLLCGLAVLFLCRGMLASLWSVRASSLAEFFSSGERTAMFRLSIEDFKNNPLFGAGVGTSAHADLYKARPGALYWYHSYFPQIVGSMGIVGILAYAALLVFRGKLILYRPTKQTVGVALTYFGLFLYSQTDPGEFMPIPYGMLAILGFVLLERRRELLSEEQKKAEESGEE